MDQSQGGAREAPRQKLKAFRTSRQLTVGEMAEQLGCSRSHLWSIFSGERKPGLELAFQIEQLTGICARAWLDDAA